MFASPHQRLQRGTLVIACLATAMLMLDIAVVNTALPYLARDLHAGLTGVQWVVDAYVLAIAAVVLSAGSVADRRGRKLVFVSGMVLFTGASLALRARHQHRSARRGPSGAGRRRVVAVRELTRDLGRCVSRAARASRCDGCLRRHDRGVVRHRSGTRRGTHDVARLACPCSSSTFRSASSPSSARSPGSVSLAIPRAVGSTGPGRSRSAAACSCSCSPCCAPTTTDGARSGRPLNSVARSRCLLASSSFRRECALRCCRSACCRRRDFPRGAGGGIRDLGVVLRPVPRT